MLIMRYTWAPKGVRPARPQTFLNFAKYNALVARCRVIRVLPGLGAPPFSKILGGRHPCILYFVIDRRLPDSKMKQKFSTSTKVIFFSKILFAMKKLNKSYHFNDIISCKNDHFSKSFLSYSSFSKFPPFLTYSMDSLKQILVY